MARIKKRADGRYTKKVLISSENGKNVYKYFYGTTIKEVDEKVNACKTALGKGIKVADRAKPMRFWAEEFLKRKALDGVGASHYKNLERWCKQLAPIYDIALFDLTTFDIQDIIDRLAQWHDGREPLAKRTLSGIKQTAMQIIELAVANRAIDYNVAKAVRVPAGAVVKKREDISQEQIHWICDTPHKAQRAAMIMLYAGLRKGEVLALEWGDINFEVNCITVNKSMEYVSGQTKIKAPKTATSVRVISMPDKLRDFLYEEFLKSESKYFLCSKKGGMINESSFRATWKSYMQELNIKYGYDGKANKFATRAKLANGAEQGALPMRIDTFTPHQLRHAYATMLYYAGIDILTARDQLGHADIQTTLAIYTHLDKGKAAQSMQKLNSYIG